MFIKNTDIATELEKEKVLLEEAKTVLQDSAAEDENILRTITRGNSEGINSDSLFILHKANPSKVFSTEAIRNICIRFRLRFLDSKYYKGELPYEAIIKIKETEKKYNVSLNKFMMIAPAEKFRLKDSTADPLLFASIGNGKYFLVHQWGNDLKWHRKIFNYPLRSIVTLALTSILFSLSISFFLPAEVFASGVQVNIPLMFLYKAFFFFIFTTFVFLSSLIYGIITVKDFSENAWESEFFN